MLPYQAAAGPPRLATFLAYFASTCAARVHFCANRNIMSRTQSNPALCATVPRRSTVRYRHPCRTRHTATAQLVAAACAAVQNNPPPPHTHTLKVQRLCGRCRGASSLPHASEKCLCGTCGTPPPRASAKPPAPAAPRPCGPVRRPFAPARRCASPEPPCSK